MRQQNYTDIRFQSWRDAARCNDLDIDPETFFPMTQQDPRVDRAKAICQTCRVSSQCLQDAIDNHYTDGVWGGRLFGRGKNNE